LVILELQQQGLIFYSNYSAMLKFQKDVRLREILVYNMMNKKPNPYSLGSHMTPYIHSIGGSRVCVMGKGQILYCVYYFIYTLAFVIVGQLVYIKCVDSYIVSLLF
jgi:hypothetical protein